MNPAPDQPPVPTVPSAPRISPTVGSSPNPQIPSTPPPVQPPRPKDDRPLAEATNYTPPTPPPVSPPPAINDSRLSGISRLDRGSSTTSGHDAVFTHPSQTASGQQQSNIPPPHPKFPFMMVTLFLVIVIAGFAGSFLFFSYSGNSSRKAPTQILITPPVSMAPTAIPTKASANPFATPSSELANPFASPSASAANPFGTYQNPFQSASPSGNSDQPYQNPFEKLK